MTNTNGILSSFELTVAEGIMDQCLRYVKDTSNNTTSLHPNEEIITIQILCVLRSSFVNTKSTFFIRSIDFPL